MLDAALAWAARGFRVFPITSNGKVPFEQGWTLSATTNPEQVRARWTDPVTRADRCYNVGVLTSDHVVIDVDTKAGKPGLETMMRLGLEFDTLTVRTPTGGWHLYFKGIGREVGQSPLGPGLDVRSHHGYALAPGSTIDGVPYVVELDLPVAEFPHELRPLLKAPRSRRANGVSVELDQPESLEIAAHWLRREAPPAVQGENGDDQTYKVACRVRDYGVSEQTTLDLLIDEWNEKNSPPWSVHELRLKVENAFRYATGEAGSASPASLFEGVVDVPRAFRAGDGGAQQSDTAKPLMTLNGCDFAAREPHQRPWLVKDIIPDRTVTLLGGDGGTGKSLLALQLSAAVAAARDWIGTVPEAGGVIYFSAEDKDNDIHLRLIDIVGAVGIELDALRDLHVVPLAGLDAILAVQDRNSDQIAATPLWHSLVATVQKLRPRLIVLDTLADAFSGNENSRPQALQFVSLLRGLAIANDLAVLLLGHPSLTGLSSGTGTSGSTAWSNSVRSRLYLERVKADGEELDADIRLLKVMKANYAASGAEVRLRWARGVLRLDGGVPTIGDKIAAEAKAEQVFLRILERLAEVGRDVSPHTGRTFAPAIFAKQPDVEGCSKKALERAMERLLAAGKIKVEKYGPPSRSYSRLVADNV